MFEVVIEESPASPTQTYDERTRAIVEEDEVQLVYEYCVDGTWEAWDDVGAHVPIDTFLILAGLLENRYKLTEAIAKQA